jgi:DNA-binding transcriptional MerR regulator
VLPDVGRAKEFNKTAFSLGLKEVSPVIEGPSAYYLLKLKERKEPAVPPLESVRSSIEKKLREDKAFEQARQRGKTLLEQLRKDKDIRKLAKDHGLSLGETGWFLRKTSEIPKVGALQEVKSGGIPISSEEPIPDRIYTQKASICLFAFKESQGADMERFEREKTQLLQQMLAEKKQKALLKFIDSLKGKAQIKMRSQMLEES